MNKKEDFHGLQRQNKQNVPVAFGNEVVLVRGKVFSVVII